MLNSARKRVGHGREREGMVLVHLLLFCQNLFHKVFDSKQN